MTDFLSKLPAPSRSTLPGRDPCLANASLGSFSLISSSAGKKGDQKLPAKRLPPPYGKRKGWLPKTLEDFGNGGAFPEIFVAQFPLPFDSNLSSSSGSTIVPLQVGDDGKIAYDAVIRQGLDYRTAIHTRPEALKPKWSKSSDLQKPSELEARETENKTREALEVALARKLSRNKVKNGIQEPEYIKYTPNDQAPGHNPLCSQRLIRMIEAQVDPMEPPKFKHKRVPRGPPSPPPAVLHSPPRRLSAKDQAAWKIPPCVSNWKNQKGYTIPLDKRLQADGRMLQEVTINDKFASLSEALYVAERAAREEIRIRNELVKQKKQKEELAREQQLRELAAKARAERASIISQGNEERVAKGSKRETEPDPSGIVSGKLHEIEKERRREIKRDLRLERAGKKNKRSRDEDRDISEKVALGQAKPSAQEAMFDFRLFNQSAGLDSGFLAGDDETCNLYDKPLFADRSKENVYRYDKERMEQSLGSSLPVLGAHNSDPTQPRSAPIEFEADTEDPFGLESLIESTVKTSTNTEK